MQIKHILLASDFSDLTSVSHAAALALQTGARVTLLTVNEAEHPRYQWMEEYLRHAERQRTRLLDEAKAALARHGVQPAAEVRAGDAAEEICGYAHEHQVDLVLMGQRGLRNVDRLLLGRTVRRALRRVDVPVMVVPAADDPQQLPRYERLLAAVDFSRPSLLNLRASLDLAAGLDAQIEVMHVFRIPVMAPSPEELDSWPVMIPEEVRDELKDRLTRAVEDVGGAEGAARCRCTVAGGHSVAETIVEGALKRGVGLITIPTHGRRKVRDVLFGSTTESVLRLTDTPVLVFPHEHLVARYPDAR